MHLLVEPDALARAAADLDRNALLLEGAVAAFAGTGERCVPACGRAAYDAVAAAVADGARAAQILVDDLRQIAGGLRSLASDYPALDRGLVPPGPR